MSTIASIEFIPLKLPLDQPLTLKECALEHLYVWVCRVTDTDGCVGEGYTHHIVPDIGFPIIKNISVQWWPYLIGKDPATIQAMQFHLMQQIKQNDSKFYYYFLSAIDIACWDLWLKRENKPLAAHLHIAPNTTVPVYGSGGWVSYTDDELLAECQHYVDLGCKTYKFKLGSFATRDDDRRRIMLLRKYFNDITLCADSNLEYTLDEACQIANMLAEFDIHFFEEPVKNDNTDDLITLSHLTSVPIATGENRFFDDQFKALCVPDSNIRLIQADIVRCGGISALLRLLDLCEHTGRQFAAHLNPALSATVVATKPTISRVEDAKRLFPTRFLVTKQTIRNGAMTLSDEPGVGVWIIN